VDGHRPQNQRQHDRADQTADEDRALRRRAQNDLAAPRLFGRVRRRLGWFWLLANPSVIGNAPRTTALDAE